MDDEKRTGVLVIGGDERLRHALEFLVNGVRVRLADLKEVRVHPIEGVVRVRDHVEFEVNE